MTKAIPWAHNIKQQHDGGYLDQRDITAYSKWALSSRHSPGLSAGRPQHSPGQRQHHSC